MLSSASNRHYPRQKTLRFSEDKAQVELNGCRQNAVACQDVHHLVDEVYVLHRKYADDDLIEVKTLPGLVIDFKDIFLMKYEQD